jgi:hypothetical protein
MAKATKAQIAAWKKVYETIAAEGETYGDNDDNHAYWVNEESHFESICVGWCVAQGMSLDESLDFYQQMIPLELF